MGTNMPFNVSLIALVFLVGQTSNILAATQDLDETEFAKLHEHLNPKDEIWQTIPWHSSLADAQKMAAVQQKPIFIWAMDGHPLGCT